MLIEFSVANFRSLRERQTFSLARGKGDELAESNTFKAEVASRAETVSELHVLRSAAIYGPNAGGKSNFLLAMRAMRDMVLQTAAMQRGDALPLVPFRLSKTTLDAPSEFEVTFIVERVRYQYGFSATADRIHDEWLIAYPKGLPQRWLARAWEEKTQSYEWDLGSSLTGEKQLWQKSTRDNALFLSTAVQLNSQQLQPLYDWFKNTLRMANVAGWTPEYSASLCEKAEKSKVIDFLRTADLAIDDVIVEKKAFDVDTLPADIPDAFKIALTDELQGKKLLDIKTVHKSAEGDLVTFDFKDESHGTRKLFSFAGPWIDSLAKGRVLFIDELHDNLHPKLVQYLVELFHNSETNPNNAQLVFTTHETSILNQDVFRRDQIWFCEKDQYQATTVYPLTDFSPRKGRENLELSYLSGRYGALPYVRPLREKT